MSLKDDLLQKGVTEQRVAYVTQGFLELLNGQLTLAAEDSDRIIRLFKAGKMEELNAALLSIGCKLAEAVFSYKTAFLLVRKNDGKGDQIRLP
ncbi:MAG: hypothetical protein AB7S81_02540 [Bdellovibrionales bacterium]